MIKGERTPDVVKRFVVETKKTTPEFSYSKIALLVEAKFRIKIDKATVGNILRETQVENLGKGLDIRREPVPINGGTSHEDPDRAERSSYLHLRGREGSPKGAPSQKETAAPPAYDNEGTSDGPTGAPVSTPNNPSANRSLVVAAEAHYDELMAFGQLLRDRLFVPDAARKLNLSDCLKGPVWRGEPQSKENEENLVAHHWGGSDGDKRTHPLFPRFRAHLDGHPCWQTLGQIEAAYARFAQASEEAWKEISKIVAGCPHDIDPEVHPFALEEVARTVLRQVLWERPEPELVPFGNAKEMARLSKILEYEYPAIFRETLLITSEGLRNFRPMYPDFLKQPIRAMVDRQPLHPSLRGWRSAIVALGTLIAQWRNQLGPGLTLRKSITNGKCTGCPV